MSPAITWLGLGLGLGLGIGLALALALGLGLGSGLGLGLGSGSGLGLGSGHPQAEQPALPRYQIFSRLKEELVEFSTRVRALGRHRLEPKDPVVTVGEALAAAAASAAASGPPLRLTRNDTPCRSGSFLRPSSSCRH